MRLYKATTSKNQKKKNTNETIWFSDAQNALLRLGDVEHSTSASQHGHSMIKDECSICFIEI